MILVKILQDIFKRYLRSLYYYPKQQDIEHLIFTIFSTITVEYFIFTFKDKYTNSSI